MSEEKPKKTRAAKTAGGKTANPKKAASAATAKEEKPKKTREKISATRLGTATSKRASQEPAKILQADRPLVLLPVRLETRFYPGAAGGLTLRIRVFPDSIHLDTHEPALSPDEAEWGNHFHQALAAAGTDKEQSKAAWQQLAERFGATRAAWIAGQKPPLRAGKTESWTMAPYARLLPDRWMATAWRAGAVIASAVGTPIPGSLAVGPHPGAPEPENPPPGPVPVDAGMKWLVDYDEARRVGMALDMEIPAAQAEAVKRHGIERLLVFGVKSESIVAAPGAGILPDGAVVAARSARMLHDLLQAHQYTDGFAFIPQGTPTNNTDATIAGYSSADPGFENSWRWSVEPSAAGASDSNGAVTAAALGLPANLFARMAMADLREQEHAQQTNRGLWAGTMGYYLKYLVSELLQAPAANIAWAQKHFVDYVRASGPLPAIRAGKQPYGMLPVTSLEAWVPWKGEPAGGGALAALLKNLLDFWQTRAKEGGAPRMGRVSDPDRDLTETLRAEGISETFQVRHALGRHYIQHLWPLVYGRPTDQMNPYWWKNINDPNWQQNPNRWVTLEGAALQALRGVAKIEGRIPRLASLVYDRELLKETPGAEVERRHMLPRHNKPLVTPDTPKAIRQLLTAGTLQNMRKLVGDRSVLFRLLRHAMLLEYVAAADRKLRPAPRQPQEIEMVGIPYEEAPATETIWARMERAGLRQEAPLSDHIDTEIREFRAALTHLSSLEADTLSLFMRGALDLCGWRLDAWVTSLATRRLRAMRARQATGVFLGGYGWVENLRPALPPTLTQSPDGSGPVILPVGQPGFTHAPSLPQAVTAAVLRSGHLSHASSKKKDLLAMDLSSERVRLVKWILDGIRAGLPLGALLGYRLERRLHERNLDRLIRPFRGFATLKGKTLADNGEFSETSIGVVADGLRLAKLWREQKEDFFNAPGWQAAGLPGPQSDDLTFARRELQELADILDALSDALITESVYQIVRGNPMGAAATLEALERDGARPPALESLKTPRSGVMVTHRLVALFSGEATPPRGWANPASAPRAAAELRLNHWAGRFLGSSQRVRLIVEQYNPPAGQAPARAEIRLGELGLTPADVLYASGGGDLRQADLEQLILYTARRKEGAFPPGAEVRLRPERDPAWPVTDLGLEEFMELARAARRLMMGARALEPRDLLWNETADPAVIDVADLKKRTDAVVASLNRAIAALRAELQALETDRADALREVMLKMFRFSIPGAVPLSASGATSEELETLRAQAASLLVEAEQRQARATQAQAAGAGAEQQIRWHLVRVQEILGPEFVLLPRFRPANATALGAAFAGSLTLQGGDPLAVVTWQQRAAQVRDGVARLGAAMRYAEAFETGESMNLQIAQLPFQTESDRWVGLPASPGGSVPGGRLSLVAQMVTPFDPAQPIAGLLLDEWAELIPAASETTGVVCQYDQPDACAPQTILLAVPPQMPDPTDTANTAAWTAPMLQQVLLETMDLMQARAVPPSALGELGQYLPALYFPLNTAEDTISLNFFSA